MNASRLVNMVMRMAMRRLVRAGVSAGIDAIGRRRGKGLPQATAMNSRPTLKRARSAVKMARRIGRM